LRAPRRRTRRRIALTALFVALAAAVAALWITRDNGAEKPVPTSAQPAATAYPVGAPIPVPGPPTAVLSSPDAVWVVTGPQGRILRLDQGLNKLNTPGELIGGRPAALAAAFRSVWIASTDSGVVTRFSPHTLSVTARIPVGDSPVWLTADSKHMWVLNREDDTLMPIAPLRDQVSGRPIRVGDDPTAVAWGHRALWVTNTGDDTLSRVDPRGRKVVETIEVGDHPTGMAITGDSVWVANFEDDNIQRVEIATNRVTATIPVGDGPNYPRAGRSVWVPNSLDGTISQIDPRTNRVVGEPIRVGQTVDRMSTGAQGLWVISYADQTLMRLQGAN
jgi:YVTN family beta-propeller protein